MQTTSSSARKRHINIQHTWLKSLIAVGGGYRLNIPRVNHSRVRVGVRVSVGVSTGVGDGGRRAPAPPNPPKKNGGKYFLGNYQCKTRQFCSFFGIFGNFSGKYHVKFGHFVNFSYIIFKQKCLAPQS